VTDRMFITKLDLRTRLGRSQFSSEKKELNHILTSLVTMFPNIKIWQS